MKTFYFRLFLLLVTGVTSLLNAQKTTISGVEVPKNYSFNNNLLKLNGSSIREKYFMSIYVGSLYLQEKSSNAKQIINSDNDMLFRIKVVSSLLSSNKMQSGIKESFAKVSKSYPVSAVSYSEFLNFFKDEIKKGDEFTLGYTKSSGLIVSKNGKLVGTINDLALKKALFATWLANAVSKDFTSEVLNGN